MTKEIKFGEEGREILMKGVDKLANAVKSTLGAKGKNVIIGTDFGLPQITKDGVTVAKSIILPDELENMGAALVKEVASKTAEVAGDGTTSSVVLAQAILKYGIEELNAGANQLYLKSGIDKATAAVVAELKKISKTVKTEKNLVSIATVSANNDPEIGKLIGQAVQYVGVDGNITIEESGLKETSVIKVDGLKFKQGYLDQRFKLNPAKSTIELISPLILLYDKKISNMQEVMNVLVQVMEAKRSLLIIAEDVDGEALASLIHNNSLNKISVTCVKSPGYGPNKYDLMKDMAMLTGGTFFSEDMGIQLKDVQIENLGTANKVTISKDSTIILGGNADKDLLEETITGLKEMIEQPKDNDVPFLKHRLANLTNGVATIRVGGSTEVEVSEKIDRVDDALRSTISSLEEGYVVGGGCAFIKCLDCLDAIKFVNEDENKGIDVIRQSIKEPFFQILENGGLNGEIFIDIVRNEIYGQGLNIKTGEIENLLKAGIIDPTKVSRVALENAASIAGTFLTTDCIILNISDLY